MTTSRRRRKQRYRQLRGGGRAVTSNLSLGTATGEGADALLNLEHVTGSAFDDTITGSTLNNALIGGAGNDTSTAASATIH